MTQSPNSFTCSHCRQTFDKGWTEEEAVAELARNFDTTPVSDCVAVCDDCYRKYYPELAESTV